VRIEVFCDNPVKITEYLTRLMPSFGDEPIRMKVQTISRENRPYRYNGYIEHVRGPVADEYVANIESAKGVKA
jgi:hypothetical protein